MTATQHNDKLMMATLAAQASNRADIAGKMLTAVRNANTLNQAREEVEKLIAFMQHVDVLHDEAYRRNER